MKHIILFLSILWTLNINAQNTPKQQAVSLQPDTIINSINEGTNNPVVHGYSVDTNQTNPIYYKQFIGLFVTYEQRQITNKGKLKK